MITHEFKIHLKKMYLQIWQCFFVTFLRYFKIFTGHLQFFQLLAHILHPIIYILNYWFLRIISRFFFLIFGHMLRHMGPQCPNSERWSLNYWTAWKVPIYFCIIKTVYSFALLQCLWQVDWREGLILWTQIRHLLFYQFYMLN